MKLFGKKKAEAPVVEETPVLEKIPAAEEVFAEAEAPVEAEAPAVEEELVVEVTSAEPVRKRFVFEAERVQWEKPTEPKYVFCRTATAAVEAEDEAAAKVLAEEKLRKEYFGTGCLLGEVKLVKSCELPIDWSYGYGDESKSGATAELGDLVGNNTIR